MRRIVIVLAFVAVCLLTLCSCGNSSKLDFHLQDDGTYLVSAKDPKTLTAVRIPATYQGKAVVGIRWNGFAACEQLRWITIPNSITEIGNGVFSECASLNFVYIPNSVTSIGAGAFAECTSLKFAHISHNVTSIGWHAFSGCTSLKAVHIPDSVTSLYDGSVFAGCSSLKRIKVDAQNPNYCSIDGNLYTKDQKELLQYACGKADTDFVIPDTVTRIGHYAFYGCDMLTGITIPASVTSIGSFAFEKCNLTRIDYTGTKDQQARITIGGGNDILGSAGFPISAIEKIEILDENIKFSATNEVAYVICEPNAEGERVYQIEYRVCPDDARNKKVEFHIDTAQEGVTVSEDGEVRFEQPGEVSVYITSVENADVSAKLTIIAR